MDVILFLLALLGHAFLWVAGINRIHAVGFSRPVVRTLTAVSFGALGLLPLAYAWWLAGGSDTLAAGAAEPWVRRAGMTYLAVCLAGAAAATAWWLYRVVLHREPRLLRFHRTRLIDLAGGDAVTSEEHAHHFLVHMPGNQSLQLDLTERAIEVPRLPLALDKLSIVHVSDFHFTGRVGKAFFREVVRLGNKLDPDLVAITGDLVDRPGYLDWVPDIFGRLRARFGIYFVLGNHDVRVDLVQLRWELCHSGLVDLGGRWIEAEVRGQPVVLAGSQMPWIPPSPDMRDSPPSSREGGPLRILLSHSPDQLSWARAYDFDLLLAGHTHGGQIRLPLIGPIFTPSWGGVRYASGVFHHPPTILNVTRGVSGELPLRLNCAPEMVHLVLHAMPRE